MNIEIRKLSVEILKDWLYYFDNIAFSDNCAWQGCYCMSYHWNHKLNSRYDWNTELEKQPRNAGNRNRAIELIKKGIMQGYLAYSGGNIVGWCNANDKNKYDTALLDFPWEISEKDQKIKAVVCFSVAPAFLN